MDRTQQERIIWKCRDLAARIGDNTGRIEKIAADLEHEKFNVCLVGGFSHGKTHLLNQLLETDAFPENVLPSTTVLTRVAHGEKPGIVFMGRGEETKYDFCRANLELFCAGNSRADASGILAVDLPSPLLEPDIVLYDTPGLDDLLAKRADIAFAALEGCEAALVVVSAIAPLGLNEKTFIQTYLAGRSIPKIALVVTFLDKLNPAQAKRQLAYIHKTVQENWPAIEIWSGIECDIKPDGANIIEGASAMRARIRAWADDPDLEKLRARHVCARLESALGDLLAENRTMLSNLEADRQAREKKLQRDLENLSANAAGWQELRRQFLARGTARAKELQNNIAGQAGRIYNLALADSRQSFEASLRLNLQNLVGEISQKLQEGLHADIDELLGNIRSRYGFEPLLRKESLEITPDYSSIGFAGNGPVHDLFNQVKGLDKEIIDKIVVFLPIPPIARPILQQIAHWLFEFGKSLVESDPTEHEDEIRAEIGKFLAMLEEQALVLVESLYSHIADQVREEQDQWLQKQRQALKMATESGNNEKEIARYKENISQINALLAMLVQ